MLKTLISTGGVGSCAVRNYIREFIYTTDAHRRDPKIDIPAKIVYVYGDPRNQLLSFFRRGFMRAPYTHCHHVRGNVEDISVLPEWTLESYLENGVDYYDLSGHLSGWLNYNQRCYEIMFVRYEAMADKMMDILQFMDIPLMPNGFEFRARSSDWTALPDKHQEQITDMFKGYPGWNLPDILILRG